VAVSGETRIQERFAYVKGDSTYGFIRPLGGNGWDNDAFFHQSAVADAITLRKGQRVTFAARQSERGPRAIGVQVER
jgi:cold shock CspA family protein